MSIGETLGRARRDAGLSIAEVSRQTRIGLSLIDAIENDNYSACGGDYRARATIAVIAGALGVESGPLIEAYDAAMRPGEWIAASESSGEAFSEPPDEPPDEPSEPGDTQPIMLGEAAPIAVGEPVEPASEPPFPITPEPVVPADPLLPADLLPPADPLLPAAAFRPVRSAMPAPRPIIWVTLGGVLLAVAVLGGILLIAGANGQVTRHNAVAGRRPAGAATHSARTRPPSRPASPARKRSARKRSARALVPASIAAFGPGGTGQGDSQELAHQALADKSAAPWHSAWYTTPRFGNLQSGTGLLLNMGRKVTITSVRIALGKSSGTDLALRIGNSPTLAGMPPAAHADGTGGVVRLRTAPTRGRYVLVWFTRLPPNQAGTFQVYVYDIKLRGYL